MIKELNKNTVQDQNKWLQLYRFGSIVTKNLMNIKFVFTYRKPKFSKIHETKY